MRASTTLLLLLAAPVLMVACGSDRYLVFQRDDDDDDDGADDEDPSDGLEEDGGSDDGGSGDGGSGDGGSSSGDGGSSSGDGGSSSGDDEEHSSVAPGDLVVSEIMIDPTAVGDAEGEWIEVYNDSDLPIKLQGLVVGDEGVDWWAIEDNATVQPGDYAVICAVVGSSSNGGVSCDATFHYNTWGEGFALSNGGDEVVIALPDGVVIDEMSYSEGQVVPGASLGVDPWYVTADDNDYSSAWCDQWSTMSGGDHGTPGYENDYCW